MNSETRNVWTTLFAFLVMLAAVMVALNDVGCLDSPEPTPPAYKCDEARRAAFEEACIMFPGWIGWQSRVGPNKKTCRYESGERFCVEVAND